MLTASSQYLFGNIASISVHLAIFIRYRFFLSTVPFCSGIYCNNVLHFNLFLSKKVLQACIYIFSILIGSNDFWYFLEFSLHIPYVILNLLCCLKFVSYGKLLYTCCNHLWELIAKRRQILSRTCYQFLIAERKTTNCTQSLSLSDNVKLLSKIWQRLLTCYVKLVTEIEQRLLT